MSVVTERSDGQAPIRFDQVRAEEFTFLGESETRSALCLSGGGIRSASFSLGVLQGLARAGVLGGFDYLSTVSGGGYIGGWLSAWRLRARQSGDEDPLAGLSAITPGRAEPMPLHNLRRLLKFLTPRTGLLSADVWTLIGTMLRNLVVNWMVLLPLIAAAVMVPRLYLGLLGLPSQPELVPWWVLEAWYRHDWIAIIVLVGVASIFAALQLPSTGRRSSGTSGFLKWFLGPVLLIHLVFSVHRYWAWRIGEDTPLGPQLVLSAAAMTLPWIVGGLLSGHRWRPWIWGAAAAAGVIGRLGIWWGHNFLTGLAHHDPLFYVVFDTAIGLPALFLQIALFVALASRNMTDEDREWWARAGAWLLIAAVVWTGASAVSILGPLALDWSVQQLGLSNPAGRAGFGVMTLVAATAHRAGTAWWLASGASGGVKKVLFAATAPLIVLLLVVLAADANRVLLVGVHNRNFLPEHPHPVGASLPEDLLVFFGLALLALALGRIIAINRFSLHGMYKDRLVRTFLGASRPERDRSPSAFTGFDPADDVAMPDLAQPGRPLHVVNATLNRVSDHSVAAEERKACSFTVTALHAGSADVGYRPATRYGGGISLGQALTTSGAAVNSNMGTLSSPALTFLLTVFNARLGVWLGNPGAPGRRTWFLAPPAVGVRALVNELLGLTTDRNPYVNLSDGGHFENLAIYEMIRRRCRFIVAVDAGADPDYVYADLANLVRLARIDFGVDVEFPDGVRIGRNPEGIGRRFAVARVKYSAVDPALEDGLLLYLKPTLLGNESIDVANYARTNPPFPHQSTTNQWFDTAQFESYRALGEQTVASVCGTRQFTTVRELCESVAGHSGA